MKLKNKVALITGAASGIGRETALLFAKEGAKVVVVDVNTREGKKTVKLIEAKKKKASFCKADVSSAKDCKRMINFAKRKYGGLHILFNNAGIMHSDDGDSQSTEEDVFDLTMNINVKGVFLGCKYGIPLIKDSGGGSVINTASFVAHLGAATPQVAYTASRVGSDSCQRESTSQCIKPWSTTNRITDEVSKYRREKAKTIGSYSNGPIWRSRRDGKGSVISGFRRQLLHDWQ